MNWIPLKRPGTEAYRIKFQLNQNLFSFDIVVLDGKDTSAKKLAQRKFSYNNNSAFIGENIPLYQQLNQCSDLVAWGCRYRWVNGGDAPFRKNDLYMEISDKIIYISYFTEPENFDKGLVLYNKIVNTIEPVN
jgi:hypothetical protein